MELGVPFDVCCEKAGDASFNSNTAALGVSKSLCVSLWLGGSAVLTYLEQSAVGVTWKGVDDTGAVDEGHKGGGAEVVTDGEGAAEELRLVRYFIIRVHCLSELGGCARL
jgi:hypothetical protein